MNASKDYYSLLNISPEATQKEVRAAYIRISRILHPDRFNPEKQEKDWQEANRMMREINEAYQVLKDTSKRRKYDQLRGIKKSSPADNFTWSSTETSSPKKPEGPDPADELRAGEAQLRDLPKETVEMLIKRQNGNIGNQFYSITDSPTPRYLKLLLWLASFLPLYAFAISSQWGLMMTITLLTITICAAIWAGQSIHWLLRYHTSTLKCRVYITPLYVIETYLDEVRWWPAHKFNKIQIVYEQQFGKLGGTSVNLRYKTEQIRFTISPLEVARNWVKTLKRYGRRFWSEHRQGNWDYINNENDFSETNSTGIHKKRFQPAYLGTFGAPLLIGLFAFFGFYNLSMDALPGGERTPGMIARPMPTTGTEVQILETDDAVIPFELISANGKNHLVRIYSYDEGQTLKYVFVRRGQQTITKVPEGEYSIYYATGTIWYGPNDLFGSVTEYYRESQRLEFRIDGTSFQSHSIPLADSTRLANREIMPASPRNF